MVDEDRLYKLKEYLRLRLETYKDCMSCDNLESRHSCEACEYFEFWEARDMDLDEYVKEIIKILIEG